MKESDVSKLGLLAQLIVVLTLITALLAGQERQPSPPQAQVNSVVVLSGPTSQISSARYHRIGDQEKLDALWYEHLGAARGLGGWPVTVDHSPQVDFRTHEVLGFFQGRAGNIAGLMCGAIDDDSTRRRVRFRWKGYQTAGGGADSPGGGNDTTAWGMIVLPRSPLPIIVEKNVQGRIGAPPIWRQVAVLDPPSE